MTNIGQLVPRNRPMTGVASCSNLKKVGWNRCQTALHRRLFNDGK